RGCVRCGMCTGRATAGTQDFASGCGRLRVRDVKCFDETDSRRATLPPAGRYGIGCRPLSAGAAGASRTKADDAQRTQPGSNPAVRDTLLQLARSCVLHRRIETLRLAVGRIKPVAQPVGEPCDFFGSYAWSAKTGAEGDRCL